MYCTTEMYLILRTKAVVGNESFKTALVGETSGMHCSGVTFSSYIDSFVSIFYEL